MRQLSSDEVALVVGAMHRASKAELDAAAAARNPPGVMSAYERKVIDNHMERAYKFDRLASELAAPGTVVKLETKTSERHFQGPGTSGHRRDCRCAACRNFDD